MAGLFRYFFKLAWIGFGGPLAHISMMQQETVEKRKWLSKEEFTEILGMTNMLPGPNSTELAIHIGYVKGGRKGAVVSGLAFTLPGFFIMLVLSWLYFQLGSIPSVSGIFYGINPAVIVIIAITAVRLGRSSVRNVKSLAIVVAVFFTVLLTDLNEAIVLLSAGIAGLLLYAPKKMKRALSVLVLVPSSTLASISLGVIPTWLQLFTVFLKAGALLFGSGLVIVPLIASDVVGGFGWMSYKQFFDGVTLGQVTPGPVVKTAAFVGYSVGGVLGAGVATLGVFLPPFVIVTLLAPVFRRMKSNEVLQGFLKGVRPGAVGAILAVAVSLGETALIDVWTIAIAAVSLIALAKFKASIPLVVMACGVAGVAITLFHV
ncbi:MAG: chromate efflux transporter [Thaumarchaeota archaeon]|nr:chromate efflux transporter [Nitrososphaerota archaeon]